MVVIGELFEKGTAQCVQYFTRTINKTIKSGTIQSTLKAVNLKTKLLV